MESLHAAANLKDADIRVTRPWHLWGGVTAAVLVVATVGYAWTGSPKAAWQSAPLATATPADQTPDAQRFEAMVSRLAERLRAAPDDAQGWAMLARSLTVLGRHQEALSAYEKARALRGDDLTLLVDHADALAVARGGRIGGEPMALLQRALQLDPDNLKALSLAGSEAFDRSDYTAAAAYWEHARRVAPAGSPYVAPLESGIAEARSLAGAAPAPLARSSASAPAAAGSERISGTVSLATSLRSRVRPEDTVFVYARAVQGSRRPVAIVRRQAGDLPFDFTLDDADAMSPTQRLSSLPQVTVLARISRSGHAAPEVGDLVGEVSPVAPGSRGLKLEISRVAER